jgi:hypothetical protein
VDYNGGMSQAEIVQYQEPTRSDIVPLGPRASFLPTQNEYHFMQLAAENLASTEFVPRGLRGKPPAVLAAMLTGREMGIGPMRALRQINVIDGKPSPEPELLMARVLDRGHYMRVAVTTKQRCVVRARRKEWADDEPTFELEWDLDDAIAAELVELKNGKPWAKSKKGESLPWMLYTRGMLRSRCVGEVCRAVFPDITEGASYAPEELTQGQIYDAGAGTTILEGLPDEIRARVEDAADPAKPVQDLADEMVEEGWLSDGERTTMVAYARKHEAHPPLALERLRKVRDERGRQAAEAEATEATEAEVVDVSTTGDDESSDGAPAEDRQEFMRGLSEAEYDQLQKWKVDDDTLAQFAGIASKGRTYATHAGSLTIDEIEAVMVLGKAASKGSIKLDRSTSPAKLLVEVEEGKTVEVPLATLLEAAAPREGGK